MNFELAEIETLAYENPFGKYANFENGFFKLNEEYLKPKREYDYIFSLRVIMTYLIF